MLKKWQAKNPDVYEFIMFNLMSGVATLVNFIVLWFSVSFLYKKYAVYDFNWFIFDYPVKESGDGGLCGFLAFLTAYTCAQIANFFVQRKYVFKANTNIAKVLPIYILTICIVAVVSVWLPPFVMSITTAYFGGKGATYFANIVNIIVQTILIYPMMKFIIMKKE